VAELLCSIGEALASISSTAKKKKFISSIDGMPTGEQWSCLKPSWGKQFPLLCFVHLLTDSSREVFTGKSLLCHHCRNTYGNYLGFFIALKISPIISSGCL
jgi:hypothetical protein